MGVKGERESRESIAAQRAPSRTPPTACSAANAQIQPCTPPIVSAPLPICAAESAAVKTWQRAACPPSRHTSDGTRICKWQEALGPCTVSMCQAQNACSMAAHRRWSGTLVQGALRASSTHPSQSLTSAASALSHPTLSPTIQHRHTDICAYPAPLAVDSQAQRLGRTGG